MSGPDGTTAVSANGVSVFIRMVAPDGHRYEAVYTHAQARDLIIALDAALSEYPENLRRTPPGGGR